MSEKTMMLVESTWQDGKTFKMMPISNDCPYVECIFDPTSKVFVVISKVTKTSLHMLPKLDEYGKAITGNKGAKQDRKSIDTFQEYYIEDVKTIKEITDHFAINAKKFDTDKFTKAKTDKPSIAAVVD
ncbi:unnamed protein product [marine sediment metagenome]|uniref:Uncharacterized protein n=1 Tax=marine sediment metagenome TaxID=412755 RepID=X1NCT0_9ZZZZ